MPVRNVLLLGNPKLYEVSRPVRRAELSGLGPLVQDLHDTLVDFRKRYGAGRAIAAPQIGVMKRIVYLFIDRPVVFLNPVLKQKSRERREVWDDCMCFPNLLVNVRRHRSCRVGFRDLDWKESEMPLEGDLSELLQHECDHLDGVLAVSRAVDRYSFSLKSQKDLLRRSARTGT